MVIRLAKIHRHTRKKVPIQDVVPEPEKGISQPPLNMKKVKNVYWDPNTNEVVLEIEE